MSSFDAGNIVEPLDYDFTKFGGRKAEIPEPDEELVIEMYAEMDALTKEVAASFVELPENPSAQDLVGALNLVTMSEAYKPMLEGMTKIYAKLCSGSPSEDELKQLPPRIRGLFFQWMAQQMRPELSAVDTKPALKLTRIGQGG